MAGPLDGFDAATFRDAIHFVQKLAAPPDTEQQATFFFPRVFTATTTLDEDGVPFDPTAQLPGGPVKTPVQVPVAIRYLDGAGKIENFGVLVPSRVVLTLLDVDYARIRGFSYVALGGQRYWYVSTEPPVGLGSVGIWNVHCRAEDEG